MFIGHQPPIARWSKCICGLSKKPPPLVHPLLGHPKTHAPAQVSFCNANQEHLTCPDSSIPPQAASNALFRDKRQAQQLTHHSFPDTDRVISDNSRAPTPTHAPPRCIHRAPSSACRAKSPVTRAKHSAHHPKSSARHPKSSAHHPNNPNRTPQNKKGRAATGSSPATARPPLRADASTHPSEGTSRSPAPPCRANRAPIPWRNSSSPEPLPSTFSSA